MFQTTGVIFRLIKYGTIQGSLFYMFQHFGVIFRLIKYGTIQGTSVLHVSTLWGHLQAYKIWYHTR